MSEIVVIKARVFCWSDALPNLLEIRAPDVEFNKVTSDVIATRKVGTARRIGCRELRETYTAEGHACVVDHGVLAELTLLQKHADKRYIVWYRGNPPSCPVVLCV